MNYIKDFQPSHYDFYLKKCEKIIGDCTDINCWVESLEISDILIWLKTSKAVIRNHDDFENESFIFITLIITLFMLELDISDKKIELSNKEIEKIAFRTYKILQYEYGYKSKLIEKEKEHTLLKDNY